MKRLFETYVLPGVYLAVFCLIGWTLVLLAASGADRFRDLDRTPRPDMATSPAWQPVPVTAGASVHVVAPSDVH